LLGEKNGGLIGKKLNIAQKNVLLNNFLNYFWNIRFKIKIAFI